jgi:hypothetical protein
LVCRLDDDLRGAEAFLEHYSITERDTAEVAMQDAARRALSQYCSLFSGVADGLDLKYYPRHLTGSAGGVIVSPIGEGNPRLNNMVNVTPRPIPGLAVLTPGSSLGSYIISTDQHESFVRTLSSLMRTRENFPVGHPSQIAPSQERLT